jgi:uncharacterized repeat protein (TIGR02543 family)
MLKKFTWIAAALIAMLAMAFFGCTDLGEGLGDGDRGAVESLPEIVVDGADIVLTKIGNGGGSAGASVDGNKYKLVATGATGTGFSIPFPAEVKGKVYKEIVVEMEVVAITSPDFISFNAKEDNSMGTDVLIVGHTQIYHNEFKIGTVVDKAEGAACGPNCLKYTPGSCVVGAKGKAAYPYEKFPKELIAFQYNPYAGDITNSPGSGALVSNFEIAVTKVTFVPYEGIAPPPVLPPTYTGKAGMVEFTAGAASSNRADDIVTDTDPSVEGRLGMKISSTGYVTMTENSVLYYKFPTSAKVGSGDSATTRAIDIEKDFDTVEFTFAYQNVEKGITGATPSDGNFKVIKYTYENDAQYGTDPGTQYQEYDDFGSAPNGTGTVSAWGAYGSGGIAIRYNWNDRNGSGAISMDVKLTKVTFTTEQRWKVNFYDGNSAGVAYDVIEGNKLTQSAIPASVLRPTKAGWTFGGWYEEAALTTAVTTVEADMSVYAKWTENPAITTPALDKKTITATPGTTGTLFDAKGSYAGGDTSGATYSYNGKTWWIVADTRTGQTNPPQWEDWTDGRAVEPFDTGAGATTRDAIKTLQDSYGSTAGYTRIGIDFKTLLEADSAIGTAWIYFDKITITYDLVLIGGDEDEGKYLNIRWLNDPDASNSSAAAGYPNLEEGNDKTITVNMSSFLSGGIGITKNNAGAFLLRISKIEFFQE